MIAKSTLATLGLLSALAVRAATASDGDTIDTRARTLAAGCASCHPPEAKGAIPPLGDLGRDEILQKLRDYRDGKTPATVMHQIARGYTDEELHRIASFLSATPMSFEP